VIGRGARASLFVGGILAAAALPLLGRAVRSGGEARCAFNGVRIDPARAVRITDTEGRERTLCCVDCARRWLERAGGAPRGILVPDEATGMPVPAGKAWFVESRVLAFPVCGCRIHAFAREADARRHAEEFGGLVLEGDRRPFSAGKETTR